VRKDHLKRPPIGVMNEALWIKQCCQIRARAEDFLEGRIGLFDVAAQLRRLAFATRVHGDADFLVFDHVLGDSLGLPVGAERAYWSAEGLAREDVKIRAVETRWRELAVVAAKSLTVRYAWSLDARARLRSAGMREENSDDDNAG